MPRAAPAPPDLRCACTSLRKAARAVGRHYERRLTEAGITATQFAILRGLERGTGACAMSRLAEDLVMDRTSLYRAAAPLLKEGLVAYGASPDRRTKSLVLTAKGTRKIAQALPFWREAQASFLESYGRPEWGKLAGELMEVVERLRAADAS